MAAIKKPVPVKKKETKTLPADDFDNNPATILRNGGTVRRTKKGLPKKAMGGKIVKNFSKPVSQGLDEMRYGGKVKRKK
jgi:hypothetical protein